MFPHKKPMTPNQVMGHHQLMMQQGVSAGNIATSIATLNPGALHGGGKGGGGHGGHGGGSQAPFNAFDSAGNMREEYNNPVIQRALDELAQTKMMEALAKSSHDEPEKKVEKKEDVDKIPRCFLHQKPNKNCKKCQAALKASSSAASQEKPQESLGSNEAKKSDEKKELKCSPMLKEQIVNSSYFKRLLNIKTVQEIIHEIQQDVDTIDVYNPGSKISPSCFICHVFRLSMFPHLGNELDFILDHRTNAVVRCVGFLYIRFITPPMELWDMLEEYLLDDMELTYNQEGTSINATIGEYVESLLTQDKYFDSPLPRLPVKVKSMVEEKAAPMLQHRKRMQANRRVFTADNIDDTRVEVCMDGEWMRGVAQGFANKIPSRTKVKVQLEGGVDVKVHLGKIILADEGQKGGGRRRDSRSRSRSRGRRAGSPDWSRWKGKSDADMLTELRERNRDQAVTSHGKQYAKRPLTFDASMASTALANPAGEPVHVHVSSGSRRGTEDEIAEEEARLLRKQREEDERQRRLAGVFKKYCATPSTQSQGSAYKEVDTPDVMRLG